MDTPTAPHRPEVWAGIECTVNRVGERYSDQLVRSGHEQRPDDIDRLAELGVRGLRYPALWERHAANSGEWKRTTDRLARIRAFGIRPILGLVHHGSGPAHTNLADAEFAVGLAAFAGKVARQLPWVSDYTPVNEPLTTARFSGLYGHWYPHGRDDQTFLRCLITQCRAVVLAMAAIRRVNPAARLIQTEDLGFTSAPPLLRYQAEFENHRRWVSWDLLCGRIDRAHPLWDYCRWAGLPEDQLAWFADHPCPPDVIGVNHYITSERYLDDRLERYPAASHGGNGKHAYVDVEAVRALPQRPLGLAALLRQTWERYRRPIAVTEAHLGCTREEQIRWLRDVWNAATEVHAGGADMVAVTAWAAFGAFDWDSLVTLDRGHYEPGLFDVRSNPPRPTALAHVVRELAQGQKPSHPVLEGAGWWQRPVRLLEQASIKQLPVRGAGRPILIVGVGSALGRAFARACHLRGLPCLLRHRREFSAYSEATARMFAEVRPWAMINADGYPGVDAAESEPERCQHENTTVAVSLATACVERRVRFVTFSTDLVFDGQAGRGYCENDAVAPLNVYGATKAEAEQGVQGVDASSLVVRTGALFGTRQDFVSRVIRTLRGGAHYHAPDDVTVTPTYAPDLVHAVLDLLIDGESGVCHLATPEPATWADLARTTAQVANLDPGLVEGRPVASFAWPAPRPAYTPLTSVRGITSSPIAECLSRHVTQNAPLKGA